MQIVFYKSGKEGLQVSKNHTNQVKKIVPKATVLIVDKLTPKLLDQTDILILVDDLFDFSQFKQLKWVHATSAGVNRIVDTLIGTKIILTNSSGVHPIPIAEQVMGYMLMFARDLHKTTRAQEKKEWIKNDVVTFELHVKTIGIIGLGRIGKRVAELAKAFQMRVIGIETKPAKEKNVDEVFTMKSLDKVLNASDFVVNCLPGTPETVGLFGIKQFKHMKKSAYFINIGRGVSAVEEDLIKALQTKTIAGAGLDVFETEPLPKSSKLWNMPNVILTPHIAGKTPEYMNRVMDIFCENLKAYQTGKPMPNEVDKKRGY